MDNFAILNIVIKSQGVIKMTKPLVDMILEFGDTNYPQEFPKDTVFLVIHKGARAIKISDDTIEGIKVEETYLTPQISAVSNWSEDMKRVLVDSGLFLDSVIDANFGFMLASKTPSGEILLTHLDSTSFLDRTRVVTKDFGDFKVGDYLFGFDMDEEENKTESGLMLYAKDGKRYDIPDGHFKSILWG